MAVIMRSRSASGLVGRGVVWFILGVFVFVLYRWASPEQAWLCAWGRASAPA